MQKLKIPERKNISHVIVIDRTNYQCQNQMGVVTAIQLTLSNIRTELEMITYLMHSLTLIIVKRRVSLLNVPDLTDKALEAYKHRADNRMKHLTT